MSHAFHIAFAIALFLSMSTVTLAQTPAAKGVKAAAKVSPLEYVRIKGGNAKHAWSDRMFDVADFDLGKYEITVGQFREFAEGSGYHTIAELVAAKDYDTANEIIQSAYSPALLKLAKLKVTAEKPDWHAGKGLDLKTGKLVTSTKYSWRNCGFRQEDDHPVFNVTFADMNAFCRWRSEQDGATIRMPLDIEFDLATKQDTDDYAKKLRSWVDSAKPRKLTDREVSLAVAEKDLGLVKAVFATTSVKQGDVSKLGLRGLWSNGYELWDTKLKDEDVPLHHAEAMCPPPETPGFYSFRVVRELN